MEIIKEIVQNIVILVLLNVLLEMLLPTSSLSRYIKLVMGLFIIVAVLNPILGFINKDLSIMTVQPAAEEGTDDLQTLLRKGRAMADNKRQSAMENYERSIGQQVSALARLNGKQNIHKVVVQTEDDPEKTDYGGIREIKIYLTKTPSEGTGAEKIQPVEINVGGSVNKGEKATGQGNSRTTDLQQFLADFYGLDPERIKVIENKGD